MAIMPDSKGKNMKLEVGQVWLCTQGVEWTVVGFINNSAIIKNGGTTREVSKRGGFYATTKRELVTLVKS